MISFLILLIAASSVTSCARRVKFNPFVAPHTLSGRMMQQGHTHSQMNSLDIQMQDFLSRSPDTRDRTALHAAQLMDFASAYASQMREFQQLQEDASNTPEVVLDESDIDKLQQQQQQLDQWRQQELQQQQQIPYHDAVKSRQLEARRQGRNLCRARQKAHGAAANGRTHTVANILCLLHLAPAAAYVQRPRGAVVMTATRPRRSISLPFVDAPEYLDGVLPGDVGFDPLGFADESNLARMREAEVRHGRLAMVATWGWPIADVGLRIAQALVPPASVCTGNGCAVDATTTGLTLPTIALIGETYWTTLLIAAIAGELRAQRLPVGVPAFDPLNLASRLSTSDDEAARLALAELKHGRLAMAAFAAYGIQKLSSGQLTFAHQMWGETCVNSLRLGGKAAGISTACFPQDLQQFDFVLSWEIMYRVITGYFSEPYF